ncbi:hypothetical protein [Salinibacterium sp. ZJ450]|uniref:hypothetical protein n=1 Tax=Salinibacterium sp. ZJ450 TaxID=2708338 RepID=UPI0014220857|nr:hypothetical protein [Salinibacterium sp. ZJ450]
MEPRPDDEIAADTRRVIEAAGTVLHPSTISIWLDSPNQWLGHSTPRACIERGDTLSVLSALEAQEEGGYA